MSHETQEPPSPQQFWAAVAVKLKRLSERLAVCLPNPAPVTPPNGNLDRWRAIWAEHDRATTDAARDWLQDETIPEDPAAIFHLWVRAGCAAWMARLAAIQGPDILFFAPMGSVDDTIARLLVDWWRHGGDADGLRRLNELQYMRPDHPTTAWGEVFPRLQSLHDSLNRFSRRPKGINLSERLEDWPKCWMPSAQKVEAAVEDWLNGETLPTDRELGHWLWMRSAAALALVRQVVGVELFPACPGSSDEIVRYLLGTWWNSRGASMMWDAHHAIEDKPGGKH